MGSNPTLSFLNPLLMSFRTKLTNRTLSDGSSNICSLSGHSKKWSVTKKNQDYLNHFVWSGKRSNLQIEVFNFVNRLQESKK